LARFAGPVLIGAFAFHLYRPHHLATYPLFAVSALLATVICFGCRYVVNAAAYWLLDARGPQMAWLLASNVLTGLYFPLSFLPGRVAAVLWWATPFPWMIQAPVDIVVERRSPALIGGQLVWAAVTLALAGYVQRRGEHRLVVQGG
jgi:ABC-2 type transport system permease protein